MKCTLCGACVVTIGEESPVQEYRCPHCSDVGRLWLKNGVPNWRGCRHARVVEIGGVVQLEFASKP